MSSNPIFLYLCLMSLPYFYEENVAAGQALFVLGEETSKHCVQVLRMKPGEQMELTNGRGGLFTAEIVRDNKRACEVRIVNERKVEKPAKHISIGISLLKNASRFEWFLEKAVETGVSHIIPLLCSRTERQHFRQDRMQGIVIAAMLQSQQAWLPVLHQPTAVGMVAENATQQQRLVAHCLPQPKQAIKELPVVNEVLILIGPEGDFTPEEINDCLTRGFIPVTLGNTRLRTETAGITATVLLANT